MEITIKVHTEHQDSIQEAIDLLSSMNPSKASALVPTPTLKPEKPEKVTKKKAAEIVEKMEDPVEKEAPPAPTGSAVNISEVRALLAKKVTDNREEIKAKLVELGAKNVTTMGEENYADFITFLNTL